MSGLAEKVARVGADRQAASKRAPLRLFSPEVIATVPMQASAQASSDGCRSYGRGRGSARSRSAPPRVTTLAEIEAAAQDDVECAGEHVGGNRLTRPG